MQLGSAYLGQLVDQFGGSYVMATAAYNAGPGRPTEWTAYCGDPRAVVDRSGRLHRVHPVLRDPRLRDAGDGGDARSTAPASPAAPRQLTLPADLKRGGYGYGAVVGRTALSAVDPATGLTSTR